VVAVVHQAVRMAVPRVLRMAKVGLQVVPAPMVQDDLPDLRVVLKAQAALAALVARVAR
jgi:hypothetical protein